MKFSPSATFVSYGRYALLCLSLLTGVCSCSAPASESATGATPRDRVYRVEFRVTPEPQAGGAWVELHLEQRSQLLREMDLNAPADWISEVGGDGQVTRTEDRVNWLPPAGGGTLRWFAKINHQRDSGGYDSFINEQWAVFRADDIIPAAATRTLKGADSDTTLIFDLPRDWSSATQYFGKDGGYRISNADRRFDRPTGWVALGELGVRHDTIAGIRVKIAGPVGQSVRRMDILALLRWTLPEITRVLPRFPARLTIVSAGDPMWRGGLSAPASLFIHADRPLISENATSTLVHELVHVGLGGSAASGADWIVEGLAELYSLEALRRSGTISQRRYQIALERLEERGKEAESLCSDASRGAVTARAVTVLHDLDTEIRQHGTPSTSLDDVVRQLTDNDLEITLARLREAAGKFIGGPATTLSEERIENCQ